MAAIITDQKVQSITVSNQGSGYTYGNVDLISGGFPTGTTRPTFNVIIPPKEVTDMTSPNGTKYRLIVDNSGILSTFMVL